MPTGIGWTGETFNVTAGCTIVGPECLNCYAMRMAARLEAMGQSKYAGTTRRTADGKVVWTGLVNEDTEDGMQWPLRIRDPQVFFLNSMSDIGHPAIRETTFVRIFSIMALASQHHFQCLTKRPEVVVDRLKRHGIRHLPANISVGVSVGMPETKERIKTLRRIPAQTRFLSLEPLIARLGRLPLADIHWVIAGGESGPRAAIRPPDPDGVREIRDQCVPAGIPFYLKQWGAWRNNPLTREHSRAEAMRIEAEIAGRDRPLHEEKGGCSLDGRLWLELPEAAAAILARRKAVQTVADRPVVPV